ncbi:MAG: diaminopimelate dehydrogenase [Eubacteriales bacterium]|nr:diaminopimelate dehydrogenase [Eubacteriales bacterium]
MIRIGIMGYGNLGRGVECALKQNPDTELVAVFTRRNPDDVKILTETAGVYKADEITKFRSEIDVLIICGGSSTDLPWQTPEYAAMFNVVDSFDTHAGIPEHFEKVDAAARNAGTTAVISAGWDPGMFSINRVYAESILPEGETYTFWGKGVSQGHSDAVRRIEGVLDARQYTIPVDSALAAVRSGSAPELSTREKHTRLVYVVAEDGADEQVITEEIVTMKNYFVDYDTTVKFIDEETMARDHSGIPHGGFVIRTGRTGLESENSHVVEYKLQLESNPEFTASVLVAVARATYRMSLEEMKGAKSILDIPPAMLSPKSPEVLRKSML